jgi:hypothetical protein
MHRYNLRGQGFRLGVAFPAPPLPRTGGRLCLIRSGSTPSISDRCWSRRVPASGSRMGVVRTRLRVGTCRGDFPANERGDEVLVLGDSRTLLDGVSSVSSETRCLASRRPWGVSLQRMTDKSDETDRTVRRGRRCRPPSHHRARPRPCDLHARLPRRARDTSAAPRSRRGHTRLPRPLCRGGDRRRPERREPLLRPRRPFSDHFRKGPNPAPVDRADVDRRRCYDPPHSRRPETTTPSLDSH